MAKRKRNPVNVKRDEIREWFDTCDPNTTRTRDALKRAAKMIWQRQTHAEQDAGQTIDDNGIGFNGYDADFASRIVKWKGTLTVKMAFAARKMLRKYARQLAEITLLQEA
jgi:hypothetical protein